MYWIVGVLTVYLLGLVLIAWLSLHPIRIPSYLSPGSLGAAQQEITVESDGNLLRAWWVEAPNSHSVMVLAHGYMMNKCELTPEACLLWKHGVSCLLIDLRAHGKSGGKKSGLGVREKEDVRSAVMKARELCPNAKIGLMGSSMGAAAIAFAMGDDPLLADLIVLDSAYGRLDRAVNGWWRFIGGNALAAFLWPIVIICAPMAGVNPFRIDVAHSLAKLGLKPVLFMHGSKDNLASPFEAQRNFDATPGPKQIVWFEGCGHSEGRWEQSTKYQSALLDFLSLHGFC